MCLNRLYSFFSRSCSILYKQCVYTSVWVSVCARVRVYTIHTNIQYTYIDAFHPYFRAFKIYLVIFFLLHFVRWLFISIHLSWCDLFFQFLSFPKPSLPNQNRNQFFWHLLNFPTHLHWIYKFIYFYGKWFVIRWISILWSFVFIVDIWFHLRKIKFCLNF